MRAQTSLPTVGVALVLLVMTTLVALSVADGQLASADREAVERRAAVAISERLVAASAPVTTRENVLTNGSLTTLSVADLRERYGLGRQSAVRVTMAGREVIEGGDPTGGTTIERIVLVESRAARSFQPRFQGSRAVTIPRRTPAVTLQLTPGAGRTITVVRSSGEVVLRETAGLRGQYTVSLSTAETARLTFEGIGTLQQGDVTITYRPAQTQKARLRVTVDRWGDPDG